MSAVNKISVDKIIPNPANPRFIKDHKFKQLMNSIREMPEMLATKPIIVDEDFMILGGNMRYKACIELGYKEVYYIQVSDWTEAQKQEFVVKDNTHYGDWDFEALELQFDAEQLFDWGLDNMEPKERKTKTKKLTVKIAVTDEAQGNDLIAKLAEMGYAAQM